jgi:hypothetical protein
MAPALDIEQLDIDEDRSSLESLRGKRVGRLVVHIRRPDDAEHVASCKSVDHLEFVGLEGAGPYLNKTSCRKVPAHGSRAANERKGPEHQTAEKANCPLLRQAPRTRHPAPSLVVGVGV